MAVLKNRAKMSTSTTGTGTITLGSSESGYQSFADAGVANADVVRYVIEDGSNFEIGTGTYTSSGTLLSRTVSESSNSNNAINLSGSATVFIGATAADIELSGNMAGDISSNGHAIKLGDRTGSGANELIMGAGDDLKLYHNGSTGHSIISETGSGNLQIYATNIELKAESGHALLTATYGGSVDLYHNSSKKAETTSSGLQTTGTLNVNGAYSLPTSDGTNGQVLTTNGSGALSFAAAGGGGADLYAANESSPAAQPSATGANAVAIGDSAVASDLDAFAGPLSRASGEYSVALGIGNSSSSYGAGGDQSISIGNQSRAMALQSAALGVGTYVDSDSREGLALGANAYVQQCDYGTAIGAAARVHGGNSASEATAFGSSYASGTSSFAAAITNNTSTYGAQNTSGIAIGSLAKAHDSGYAIAIGRNNISSGGSGCTVIGGMNNQAVATSSIITGGAYCSIIGAAQYARAGGGYSKASVHGQDVFASGQFSSVGDAQGAKYILRADTTDATATVLTTNNGTPASWNQIVAASDTCIMFSGTLVAMQNGAQDQGGWEIKGLLKNDGGTTTLVSSNIQTFDDGNGWTVALTADNTNNALAITCTGEAAHNIRWVANIQTSEVTYA